MFCRICEFGWDGAGLAAPRRPAAGEAADAEVAAGFLTAPARAAPGAFLEAAVAGTAVGPACLAAEAPPEGVAESHGLLGMAPLQPEGAFLMTGLAATMPPRGDFFGRRLLGAVCLLAEEPGRAVFLEAAAVVTFSSTLLSSFTARTEQEAREKGRWRGQQVHTRHARWDKLKIQESMVQGCQEWSRDHTAAEHAGRRSSAVAQTLTGAPALQPPARVHPGRQQGWLEPQVSVSHLGTWIQSLAPVGCEHLGPRT